MDQGSQVEQEFDDKRLHTYPPALVWQLYPADDVLFFRVSYAYQP